MPSPHPYVIIKAACSLNGYISGENSRRIIFSNELDNEEVDKLRSEVDAIFVGANTIRTDNPHLLIKSTELIDTRASMGLSPQPIKITITESGKLPLESNFFSVGDSEKWVYTSSDIKLKQIPRTKIFTLEDLSINNILTHLSRHGIKRILIEGGSKILTSALKENLFNELRLCISPKIVAARNSSPLSELPIMSSKNISLVAVKQLDDLIIANFQNTSLL